MRNLFYLFMFFATVTLSSFSQETFIHNNTQIQITVPQKWFYVLNEDGSMMVHTPNKELSFSVDVMETKNLDSASTELKKDFLKHSEKIEFENPREDKINGLSVLLINGKTTDSKTIINFTLILSPNTKILSIGAKTTLEILQKYEKEFNEMISSIKPFEKEREKEN
jgi:hypothetical protein